jgi:hypothetical protein
MSISQLDHISTCQGKVNTCHYDPSPRGSITFNSFCQFMHHMLYYWAYHKHHLCHIHHDHVSVITVCSFLGFPISIFLYHSSTLVLSSVTVSTIIIVSWTIRPLIAHGTFYFQIILCVNFYLVPYFHFYFYRVPLLLLSHSHIVYSFWNLFSPWLHCHHVSILVLHSIHSMLVSFTLYPYSVCSLIILFQVTMVFPLVLFSLTVPFIMSILPKFILRLPFTWLHLDH